MVELSLYQPDIPQNVGACVRLCACLGVRLSVILPCGFPFSLNAVRRSALDYADHLDITEHESYATYRNALNGRRQILLSTKAAIPFTEFDFRKNDILLVGRESRGVPDTVHEDSDARVLIPMRPGLRSLNMAMAGAIVLSEALRQVGGH